MLETIREYAAERLEHQGDGDSLRQRHADYFLRLAEEAEPHLTGSQQAPWLERLEAEHDNFRLSLDSLRRADRGGEELRLVGALMRFWYVRGHLREGSSRCEEALAAHDDQSQPRLKALFGAASPRSPARRLPAGGGARCRSDSCSLAASETPEAVASSHDRLGSGSSRARRLRASSSGVHGGRRACARRRLHLVSRGRHRQPGRSLALEQGDYVQARARLEEALELFRQLGDERIVVVSLVNLGSLAAREGQQRRGRGAPARGSRVRRDAGRQGAGDLVPERAGGARALQRRRRAGGQADRRDGDATGGNRTRPARPIEQRLSEQTRNALASELGEERLAVALAVGREMTFEQAMAYALQTGTDTTDTRQPIG